MSADLSTEPTMEEENFFSGLKKKKKSGTKKVLLDDEPTPAPPAPAAAAEDDEPAAEDEDNMFGDLKKKYVLSCRSWSGKSQCFWVGRTELGLTTMTSPFWCRPYHLLQEEEEGCPRRPARKRESLYSLLHYVAWCFC